MPALRIATVRAASRTDRRTDCRICGSDVYYPAIHCHRHVTDPDPHLREKSAGSGPASKSVKPGAVEAHMEPYRLALETRIRAKK